MNIKRVIFLASVFFIAGVSLSSILFFMGTDNRDINITEINDAAQTLAANWDGIRGTLPDTGYSFDFSVLDKNNSYVNATKTGLSRSMNEAIKNNDIIYDIVKDGNTLGKLIVRNTLSESVGYLKIQLFILNTALISAFFTVILMFTLYLNVRILKPFYNLRNFSRHIAEGNLDVPLLMDRKNIFGAFTESFDIMREELRRARDDERAANESKKELVATLSHDIKTPVSSIKAISELLAVKSGNDDDKKKLTLIDEKAEQINTLITNMFNATLEELTKLKVEPHPYNSIELVGLIVSSDYNGMANIGKCPEMLITMDKNRTAQVIDNVFSNSYKYSDTPIFINFDYDSSYFYIYIRDMGTGVKEDELDRIFNKFYRSENSAGKSGTGLGLYISKYFMEQMGGDIWARNIPGYFEIVIKIKQ